MRQLYTSYKRTWRRVAAPEQVLRNGGWDRADEDLGWLTNDDVRSLTSTNKQAPAKGQRVIDVTVYKRMRCSIIMRARTPRLSKVTFLLILAKSSKSTIFGTHAAYPICRVGVIFQDLGVKHSEVDHKNFGGQVSRSHH